MASSKGLLREKRDRYTLDIVVPCYHEEEVLPSSIPELMRCVSRCQESADLRLGSYRILLVDDGSLDGTWSVIEELARKHAVITGIKLSRNFGHQNALLAGLSSSTADVTISLDADLQDDVNVISDMLAAYVTGHEMALGVRLDRTCDGLLKRITARWYYSFLSKLGLSVVQDHADFRLMSRKALCALLSHREVNLYLRGLIPTLGFPVVLIPYKRQARSAGVTKYTVPKMFKLALDGVTSFSVTPLRFVAVFGIGLFIATVVTGCYVLIVRLIFPSEAVPGWASTVLPLISLGGMQILSIGILGEYIGKIYLEVKNRPRYFVERTSLDNSSDK